MYRFTFGFLLLLSIFLLAYRYCSLGGSIVVVLLYVTVYPASIRYYAGQVTDPMSHLSFVLAFLFLEIGAFEYLLITLVAGVLAKESIAIIPVYYALFERRRDPSWLKTALLCGATAFVLVGIRLAVHYHFQYGDVSGVGPGHIWQNLARVGSWPRQLVHTLLVFAPFVVLGWRKGPQRIKELTLVVVPTLIVSNLLFSWFHESRNFIPGSILLAILTVYWFEHRKEVIQIVV